MRRPRGFHFRMPLDQVRRLPAQLKTYIAVETEAVARSLETCFKTGSGMPFAKKRFW